MQITIDSRGAGAGKTTGVGGIYSRIESLLALGENVLVVVPSIHLQDQYQDYFTSHFQKINSVKEENKEVNIQVCKAVIESLSQRSSEIVCITHEAFIRMSINTNIKKNWHLIIDEAFMPFRTVAWRAKNNQIDWSSIMELPDDVCIDDPVPFFRVKVKNIDDEWTNQINEIRRLKDPSWETYCKSVSYKSLSAQRCQRAEFIQSLTISRITGWRSVHIAAAAFEWTFMSRWLTFNKINYRIASAFVPKQAPLSIHSPGNLDWSKYKLSNNPGLLTRYQEYVINYVNNNNLKLLTVRNNSNITTISGEKKIGHNAHGLNEFTDYTAANCETALRPSNAFSEWMNYELSMSENDIVMAFSAYTFYQILMRTALRVHGNRARVHCFLMDTKAAIQLSNFFENNTGIEQRRLGLPELIQVHEIDVGYEETPKGRRKKRTPEEIRRINAEKQKRLRDRRRIKK